MVYKIVYKKSVRRDLGKISKTEAGRILDQIESELLEKPESYPALKGRYAGLRRFRVGNYRVIYAMLGDQIFILRIGHRKNVYKGDVSRGRSINE